MLRLCAASFVFCLVLAVGAWLLLKWAIIRAVNAQLLGHATWRAFDIGPGVVRITEAEVFDASGQRVLTTPEIRVSYSLLDLARTFSPLAALADIVVEKPHLDVRLRPDGTFNLADVYRVPATAPPMEPDKMFHGNVLVRDGEVYFKDEQKPFVAVFQGIEGVIDMRTREHAQGRLSFTQAGPPASRGRLDATWKRSLHDLRASFDVDDLDVAGWTNYYLARAERTLPPLARGHVASGRGKARLLFSTAGPPADWQSTLHVTGSVWAEQLAGQLERFPVPIEKGRLSLVLTRDLFDIKRLSADIGGDYVEASGRLYNRRSPQIDMAVLARSRSIAGTLRRFGVKTPTPIEGRGEVNLQLLGAINGPPFVRVSMSSPRVRIAGRVLDDLSGRFDWSSGTWRVERLAARSQGGTVEARGWVFTDDHHRLVLDVRTRDASLRELVGSMFGGDARASADLTIIGSQRSPLVMGRGSVRDAHLQGVGVSRASGSFIYDESALLFSDVSAATGYGFFQSPHGFLDLGGSRQLFAQITGRGVSMQTAQGSVENGSVDLVVAGRPRHMYAAGRVRAGSVSAAGLTARDVDALVALSPDFFWMRHGTFSLGGSRITASAAVSPSDRTFDVAAWSPSLDTATVLDALHRPMPIAFGRGPFSLEAVGSESSAAFRAGFDGSAGRITVSGVRDGGGLRGVAFAEGVDASMLAAVGLWKWHPQGGADVMSLFALQGGRFDLDAVGLSRGLRVAGIPFDRVSFSASSANGLMDVRAGALSGPVASVTLFGRIPTAGDGPWGLQWNADITDLRRVARGLEVGASPGGLRRALNQMRVTDLSGHAFASGDMAGTRNAPRVDGSFLIDRATLHGDPLFAQGAFRAEHGTLSFRDTRLTMAGEPVEVRGSVGLAALPRLDLVVTTPYFDLQRALGFTPYRQADVSGRLEGQVHLLGPVHQPAVSGQVRLRDGRVGAQRLDDVDMTMRAGNGNIIVERLMARLGTGTMSGRGTLSVNGPIDLELSARDFPMREVSALQGSPLYRGRGDVTVQVRGTAANPRVGASFKLGGLEVPGRKTTVSLSGRMRWAAPRLELENVAVSPGPDLGAAGLTGYVDFPQRVLPRTFDELLAGRGQLDVTLNNARLGTLMALANPGSTHTVRGIMNGTLQLAGPLRSPTVSGTVTGANVRLDGVDVGTMQASGAYDAATGDLKTLDLTTQGGAGSLHASRTGTEQDNQISVHAADFELAALAPLVPWRFPFAGRLNASFDVSGPLFEPNVKGSFQVNEGRLSAVSFDTFSGAVMGADGIYRLENFEMLKGPHRATLSGVLPMRYERGVFVSPAPIDIKGALSEDSLDILSLFIPDILPSPGTLRASLSVTGQYPDVAWNGELTVRNGVIRHKLLGQPFENVDVSVGLKGRRLQIQHATATLGKGVLTVAGGADVKGFALSDMNFRISGKDLSVIAKPYLASMLDADLHVTGSTDDPSLGGSVTARSATITLPLTGLAGLSSGGAAATPTVSSASGPSRMSEAQRKVDERTAASDADASGAPVEAPSTGARAPFPLPPLTFMVDFNLGRDAWLQFLGSAMRAEGQVALVGKGESAIPAGVITLKQGQIQIPFFPTSMRLTNGKAYFDPRGGWTPYLEANAVARVGNYEIYVDVKGTAANPDVRLSSSPTLPQTAIRQLLLGGATAQNNIMGPTGYTQNTSVGLNALVNVAETTFLRPVTNLLGRLFGVSEVNLELVQTGLMQLTVYKALDAKQKFLLVFSSLQGSSQQASNLPRQAYGLEYRFKPTQYVRISTDNLGGVHFFYQARWSF